jgi:spermidine/putrescine transport system ATP-binding protein
MEKIIEFKNIVKSFDGEVVLKGINLDIYENEFVTLLGPSGCGKTTLLRILGGFLEQDNGEVYFEGQEISKVPPHLRNVNTIFQKYALFPHLNVYDNVAFGLKIKKMAKDVIEQKVYKMLELVGLAGFENRDISSMSGGQQQRVAIARALVNEPKVLLLDEPLAALDLKLRKEMQRELKRIQQEVGITFIFVTHDQEEALTMSDKIVVMRNGNIEQIGTPTQIYNEPANEYVANFIGESNIISGVMKKDYLVSFDDNDYECVDFGFNENEEIDVVIRPEDIMIAKGENSKLSGEVKSVLFKGVHYETMVETKIGTSKSVIMHVLANKDIFNEEANEKMFASDFTMDLEDVATLEEWDVIARANAQAWDATSEENIGIKAEYNIQPQPGKYQCTFRTDKGTSITININVVEPKYTEDKKSNIGITAFDFYKSIDDVRESMALSVDLKTWADAAAWNLSNDKDIEITDVRYDFDQDNIVEGDYPITFSTKGRVYKINTTEKYEEGEEVSLSFRPDAIHVMKKMGVK